MLLAGAPAVALALYRGRPHSAAALRTPAFRSRLLQGPKGELQRTIHPIIKIEQVGTEQAGRRWCVAGVSSCVRAAALFMLVCLLVPVCFMLLLLFAVAP